MTSDSSFLTSEVTAEVTSHPLIHTLTDGMDFKFKYFLQFPVLNCHHGKQVFLLEGPPFF